MDYSIDELISVCISRQIEDGEVVAQGIATPLVAAGYLLAKVTHAPNITFISAIGQALCRDWAPLGIATIEALWIGRGLMSVGFVQAACDLLPRFGPKEFFRPGQVDACGNFNNVFIGSDYAQPRLRLPGSGGIADVTVFEENVFLYVPRHGRHTFVRQLDFRSGLGHDGRRREGNGPRYLISDLGQFDFAPQDGRMRLTSLHPGVSLKRVQAKTGFELLITDPLGETEPPTAEELRLLREQIDPLGVRTLETLSGAARRERLRELLERERILMDEGGLHASRDLL
ncbi:MAG TPA: CoA-transferase [Candidatus Binatia bacterium]|nr:CoA-transferase [Candidatus Binatia bacterium]